MAGDNDVGAFATCGQAGQTCGTILLWTLALLIPVLYVNQEMVLRLGAVTGVGHARLIFKRFGRFWGAFSVIDLFLLNALTIVTEFIGISLALDYLGLNTVTGVIVAAGLVIVGATAIIAFTAAAFAGTPEFGNFTDAGAIWSGEIRGPRRRRDVRRRPHRRGADRRGGGVAVDGLRDRRHFLGQPLAPPQGVRRAKGFHAVYACLIAVAAAIVLTPNAPLGLLTVAVQTLAGVLLPSATVFLLLLCNDRAVLGPWVNGRWINGLTGAVIAALVALSMILTVSVLFLGYGAALAVFGPKKAPAEPALSAAFDRVAIRGGCRPSTSYPRRDCPSQPGSGWGSCAPTSSSPVASCSCALSRWRSGPHEASTQTGTPPHPTHQSPPNDCSDWERRPAFPVGDAAPPARPNRDSL
jgi:Natural resistance-associated macrophage protein